MKLVFIAIFSVILLVVCEPQQDVIGDGEAPGLYYNFGKRYGWNVDNRPDENNRHEEVDRSYSLNSGRDTKKEYDSREQSDRRNSDRGQRLDHDRYNKDDSESREKNIHRDSDRGQKLDRGIDSKNNYSSREQTYHRESESGKDDHRRYEYNHQRNNRHKDRQNESSENQRDNRYPERRNHNYKYNYENQRNDRQHNRNYNESYDKVDNRDDKGRDHSKNRDYSREDQNNDRNQDKHRNKDHGYENRKDNKSRERNNERDRNEGYGNEHRGNDKNKNENYRQREDMSKEHGFERQDKNIKYDNDNYNYGSPKNQDRKGNKYYESGNSRHYEDQLGILYKDKEGYGHILENNVQKADYNYKEQDKNGRKQNTRVINEGNKEYKKDDRNPPYRYSYIESLITAPVQNAERPNSEVTRENKNRKDDLQDYPRKQVQENKKEGVVAIHGTISKNKDLNDKEVKMDVIVKKNDNTQVHENIQNLGHKEVNLEERIHIHDVINKGSPEKELKTLKSQEGNKYENNNSYGQGNNNEKNYREGYNNHIQGKKDLLGGIELLDLLGNIGQEFKEQVIERIPGYHLIQSLEHRGQKSEIKQPYNYNLEKKGPKIDLDVYSPDFIQNEEKEKKVEKIQVYSEIINKGKGNNVIKEKEIDIYANTKGKERKENVQQGERKEGYDYSISHKPASLGGYHTNKYIEKPQDEKEYYNYGNVNQKQGLGNQGLGYVNQNNRGYIKQDLSEYQGQGLWNQQDKTNQVQDHKNKQKEEKYIFQYTIRNNLEAEQDFGKQGQKNYNIPYFLPYDDSSQDLNNKQGDVYRQGLENRGDDNRKYNNDNLRYDYINDKSNYETKPNEGWTYQGFRVKDPKKSKVEENNNIIEYNSKDGRDAQGYIRLGNQGQEYRNQQLTKVNNGYQDLSYINKGNPDYTPKYNQGIIGSGYDVYQAQHYPFSEVVNPLSQQILGSVGTVQDFYNQNYTKSNQNEVYNINPYLGDYSYPETYYTNNYRQSYYTKPGYDSSYQGSNKEYMYQYQLPYSSVFARVGLPY